VNERAGEDEHRGDRDAGASRLHGPGERIELRLGARADGRARERPGTANAAERGYTAILRAFRT